MSASVVQKLSRPRTLEHLTALPRALELTLPQALELALGFDHGGAIDHGCCLARGQCTGATSLYLRPHGALDESW